MQHLSIGTLAILLAAAAQASAQPKAEEAVIRADEAYRLAKLHNDTQALDRILAPAFNETNQNGSSRNKAQTIELWKSFHIDTLTTDAAQVRITGDTAQVLGKQTEDGADRMLFTRVYVRNSGEWQLLASMQYRDLDASAQVRTVRPALPEDEVLQADEAYRTAKLHQDVAALDRLLAADFNETNQNGHSRNKAETLDLWRSFSIASLTTDSAAVRLNGSSALVVGKQTENGSEHMLFTRVYVHGASGWQVLSSMQYRDPNDSRNGTL